MATPAERRQAKLDRIARGAGLGAVALGALALLGWGLGVETLKSVIPGLVSMKVNAALAFVLAGLAVGLMPGRSGRGAVLGLAVAVILIGLVHVAEYVAGRGFGVDELFCRDLASARLGLPPGRMALATALAFTLIGAAILLIESRRPVAGQALAFAALLVALFSLVAYLLGERTVTMISPYTSLAMPTAVGMALLAVGLLARCTSAGPMARLVAEDAGGNSLRRLLPLATAAVLAVGLLAGLGARAGLYNLVVAMVGFAVGASAVMAVAIWSAAETLSRSEAGRRRELDRFRLTLTSIGDAVIATDGRGRVTFLNEVAVALTGWGGEEAQGRPLEEVFRIVNEATRLPVANPVAKVLATGMIVGLANHTVLIGRDGTDRPIEDSAAPIRGDDGAVSGVVLVFRDVSEQMRSGRMIAEQQRFLELIARGEPLPAVLDALCRMIEDQARPPLRASILLAADGGTRWTLGAGPSLPAAFAGAVETVAIAHAIASAGPTSRLGEPAYCADIRADPLWANFADLARAADLCDCWSCPILSSRNQVLGIFACFRAAAARPSPADLKFIEIATQAAAIALERDRNKLDLDDARARLEAAMSAGSIGTWAWDLTRDWLVPDATLAKFYNLSPEEAAGSTAAPYLRQMHPEDIPRVEQAIGDAIALTGVYHVEFRILQPDGSSLPVESRGRVEYAADGRPLALPGVTLDISERKRGEAERRALAERADSQARLFDSALANLPDHVYTFDLDGRFTYANPSLLKLWGKSAAEVAGKYPAQLDYTPELAAQVRGRVLEVVASKARVSDEVRYATASGPGHYYEYIFTPVIAPDGSVEAVVGSSRDITERKRAEEAALFRATRLGKLADISTRINAAHDVNSVIRVVSREALDLFGADRAGISMVLNADFPQPVNVTSSAGDLDDRVEVVPPDLDGAALVAALARAAEPIRLTRAEFDANPALARLARLGGIATVERNWLAAPLLSRDRKPMGLIQLADKRLGDFTPEDEALLVQLSLLAAIAIENARLYDELRGNDRRKDEFLAMLAHELRNPLAAIGNAVKLLDRLGVGDGEGGWSMDVIARQMHHLTRLIEDLLDVSRISQGKIELRRDLLDATAILDSAAATVRGLVEERKHALEVAIDRGNLWLVADPTRLEQVVVNLLNNAAKYSENAGLVRLEARNEGGSVVIRVTDRGVGIAPEKLPQMFELFAQGDRSLARSEGGLGIGLTVVKKLVELHGGTIAARSEGPGLGSEFTIRLPAAARPAAIGSPAPPPVAAPEPRRARILVVDDNVDTARGMARLLKLIGHSVATAHGGPEAIEAARIHRPEVVLLDIGLPGMSGYEVAARLRDEESCRGALIIAISGYGQDEDRRRSREAGFDHHLIKPLDHDALLALLGGPA